MSVNVAVWGRLIIGACIGTPLGIGTSFIGYGVDVATSARQPVTPIAIWVIFGMSMITSSALLLYAKYKWNHCRDGLQSLHYMDDYEFAEMVEREAYAFKVAAIATLWIVTSVITTTSLVAVRYGLYGT